MKYWIDHCEAFDGEEENPWMKAEHVGRYLFAVDFFKQQGAKKIIDVACAEGYGSKLLSDSGYFVCGADINECYIKTAQKRCHGTFAVLDLHTDKFPQEFELADGAVCFETIEHLRDARVLLANLHKNIKQGGYLLLSFPSSIFEKLHEDGTNYDPFHLRIYTRDEMFDLIAQMGFSFEKEYGQSFCNKLYMAEKNARNSLNVTQEEINRLFRYDEKSIINLAKLIGYPNTDEILNSYSFLWILKNI